MADTPVYNDDGFIRVWREPNRTSLAIAHHGDPEDSSTLSFDDDDRDVLITALLPPGLVMVDAAMVMRLIQAKIGIVERGVRRADQPDPMIELQRMLEVTPS